MRMSPVLRQFLVVFLTVCSLVMVGLAVLLPLGGHDTGYVSTKFYSAITPAGWAFSIWSLIYSGLLAYSFWQALPSQRANPFHQRAALPVMGILVANGLWLPAWHYEQLPLSLLIISGYLAGTVLAVEAFLPARAAYRKIEFWLGYVFFSVWCGWLTIATLANATVVALALKVPMGGLGPSSWGIIMLAAAFLIAFTVFNRWKSPAYFLVITWAYSAIAYAHPHLEEVFYTALILGGLAAVLAGKQIWDNYSTPRPL
jgi:hypothetical protein